MHDGAAQVVPAGYSSQAPIPLQRPFVPQVDAGVMAQSLFGSVPAGTAAHAPSGWPVSAAMQAVQTPEHAVLQHTPSAQKPLPHWEAVEQAVPLPWSVVVVVVLVVVVVSVPAARADATPRAARATAASTSQRTRRITRV